MTEPTRKDWYAEVTNKKTFIIYCVRWEKFEYLTINMSLLNSHAKQLKDQVELPGVEFKYNEVPVIK